MTKFNETALPELTAKHMTYKQIQREAAQRYNNHLTLDQIRDRYHRGWDLDKIEQAAPGSWPTHIYNGYWYGTRELLALGEKKYGFKLTSHAFRRRLNRGMSIDDALSKPANYKIIRARNSYSYKNKTYNRTDIIKIAQDEFKQNGCIDGYLARNIFAINLNDYMEKHHLNYKQIGKNLAISPSTVKRYIVDDLTPTLITMVYIANQLHVTINELIKIPEK